MSWTVTVYAGRSAACDAVPDSLKDDNSDSLCVCLDISSNISTAVL